VHGGEGGGIPSIGITEDRLWELLVIAGSEAMQPYLLDSPTVPAPAYLQGAGAELAKTLEKLGEILERLEIHYLG